jgi:hypothetical protein
MSSIIRWRSVGADSSLELSTIVRLLVLKEPLKSARDQQASTIAPSALRRRNFTSGANPAPAGSYKSHELPAAADQFKTFGVVDVRGGSC